MRKKIEELRNREEGFTLVELLAVIVILGIIVAIAIPVIGNVTQRAQSDADEAQAELVIDAAQLYAVSEKDYTYPNEIEVSDLINKGYLEASDTETDAPDTITVQKSQAEGASDNAYTFVYGDYTRGAEHSNPSGD